MFAQTGLPRHALTLLAASLSQWTYRVVLDAIEVAKFRLTLFFFFLKSITILFSTPHRRINFSLADCYSTSLEITQLSIQRECFLIKIVIQSSPLVFPISVLSIIKLLAVQFWTLDIWCIPLIDALSCVIVSCHIIIIFFNINPLFYCVYSYI